MKLTFNVTGSGEAAADVEVAVEVGHDTLGRTFHRHAGRDIGSPVSPSTTLPTN